MRKLYKIRVKIYRVLGLTLLTVFLSSFFVLSCQIRGFEKEKGLSTDNQLVHLERQFGALLHEAENMNAIPRTTKENKIHWIGEQFDWTEGFFPGSCWYLFEMSNDPKWKAAAERFQAKFEHHKNITSNHDLGFVFNCSFGNGYRLTGNEAFKQTMLTAGESLITRFNYKVGAIQSWDVNDGWQALKGWEFPVIIDNMMNLELLFELSRLTGNPKYKEIAVTHANTTIQNHFRDDFSSYHVIDYDPITGEVRNRHTAQGSANHSSWARGQAWGLYGFTVCYRYTKDKKYLQQAQKIADYILGFEGMPEDGIPYWDYHAPNIPKEPRDVAAAAIAVSALIELNLHSDKDYTENIGHIMNSLNSDKYLASVGENHNFVLKHSVGSIPHGHEIDVPLNYADYYYIEALMRLNSSEKRSGIVQN